MKFKLAVPDNILTQHQISLIERKLSAGLLAVVAANFPNWKERAASGNISGGEIILQKTDMTEPIAGLQPGIHMTISLISYMQGRDFDGLARGAIALVKQVTDGGGNRFMETVQIFVQMSLDRPVVRLGTNMMYSASGDGLSLLEYIG